MKPQPNPRGRKKAPGVSFPSARTRGPDLSADLFYGSKFVRYRDPHTGRFVTPNGKKRVIEEIHGTKKVLTPGGEKTVQERISKSYTRKPVRQKRTVAELEAARLKRMQKKGWTQKQIEKLADRWDLDVADVQERLSYTGEFSTNAADYMARLQHRKRPGRAETKRNLKAKVKTRLKKRKGSKENRR